MSPGGLSVLGVGQVKTFTMFLCTIEVYCSFREHKVQFTVRTSLMLKYDTSSRKFCSKGFLEEELHWFRGKSTQAFSQVLICCQVQYIKFLPTGRQISKDLHCKNMGGKKGYRDSISSAPSKIICMF